MSGMDRDQLDYLASLARMDIRKRERALAKFTPEDGQDPDEAAAVHEKLTGDLAWKREVLDVLRGERRSDGVQAIAQVRQYLADGRVPAQDGDLITQAMWHLATEGIRPRLERLALAGALVAAEIDLLRADAAAVTDDDLAGSRKSAGMLAEEVAQNPAMTGMFVPHYLAGTGIRPPRRSGKVRGVAREAVDGGGMELWSCAHDHAPGVHSCQDLTQAQRGEAIACARAWLRRQVSQGVLHPMPIRDER